VLRAIGGKEKKVKEYIESEVARLKLEEYISQVLIPYRKSLSDKGRKKIKQGKNFFPGLCSC
jgi:transcription termination/antitermination protein NusG